MSFLNLTFISLSCKFRFRPFQSSFMNFYNSTLFISERKTLFERWDDWISTFPRIGVYVSKAKLQPFSQFTFYYWRKRKKMWNTLPVHSWADRCKCQWTTDRSCVDYLAVGRGGRQDRAETPHSLCPYSPFQRMTTCLQCRRSWKERLTNRFLIVGGFLYMQSRG